MKAILLLCLIASLSCTNLVDTVKCLLKNEKLRSIVSEAIDTVKSNNFNKLIEIGLYNFVDVKLIVQNCLTEKRDLADDEEPILQKGGDVVLACKFACGKDKVCLIDCIKAATPQTREEYSQEVEKMESVEKAEMLKKGELTEMVAEDLVKKVE